MRESLLIAVPGVDVRNALSHCWTILYSKRHQRTYFLSKVTVLLFDRPLGAISYLIRSVPKLGKRTKVLNSCAGEWVVRLVNINPELFLADTFTHIMLAQEHVNRIQLEPFYC